jgi:hypothetical protein
MLLIVKLPKLVLGSQRTKHRNSYAWRVDACLAGLESKERSQRT